MAKETPALLIVDGYNVLNAWRGKLKNMPLADARDDLIHALADYAGYTGQQIVLVFDAWKSERIARTIEHVPATLQVVFTRRGETADHYIERMCEEVRDRVEYGRLTLRVATSDSIEQTLVMGRGAIRISARELLREIETMRDPDVQRKVLPVRAKSAGGSTVMDRLPEETRRRLEKMRRGEE
ncbi:MAG: NYN domain-containing protein [Eubacteriales bacterium]|nr:NYN domain-containing protein [Eubacteriales bacterium]